MKFWWNNSRDGEDSSSLQIEQLNSGMLLNAIEDGVVLIDTYGIIRLFNPAATKITGWTQSEATGLDFVNVLQLVDSNNNPYPANTNPFIQVLKTSKPVRDNKAVLVMRSKKNTAVNLSVSPLFSSENTLTGIVAIFQDVSSDRQEERQRAEFISTASHEMRTPVAAIEGYLALAMNDKVSQIDNRARDYLEKAHISTKHLGKLFQDLLTSAKAEDGRLTNHAVVLEMGKFLEQLTTDLKFTADKKGLLVEFIVGTTSLSTHERDSNSKIIQPLYYVHVDPDRIREVITNLFDNAVKYTETGRISVGITGDKDIVQIFMQDTGSGIPAEDIPHLFEKFYRVDNSSTRAIGGTGLGLFICRKIIELYQGRIWAESKMGQGTTFFINLKRLTPDQANKLLAQETPNTLLG